MMHPAHTAYSNMTSSWRTIFSIAYGVWDPRSSVPQSTHAVNGWPDKTEWSTGGIPSLGFVDSRNTMTRESIRNRCPTPVPAGVARESWAESLDRPCLGAVTLRKS